MVNRINDREKIISLWQSSFGDSVEDIAFFLDNAHYECIGITDNGILISMLFLIECSLQGENAKYIYAACTDKEYRKSGIMTELIDYCKSNYSFLCLIPADDSLIDYYLKRGFDGSVSIDSLKFNQSEEICEYLFEGYELTNPQVMYYKG